MNLRKVKNVKNEKNELKSARSRSRRVNTSRKEAQTGIVEVNEARPLAARHFQCNLCQTTFDNLNILEVHIRNHLDDTPYRCYKCRSVFWSIEKLVEHASVKHARETHPFMCKFCLQLFNTRREYLAHDMTHTSELGFDCLDCGQIFESNDLLVEHRGQKHIGDRLYACRLCDQRFTRTTDMTWHIRKHNNLPSYDCKYCVKRFTRVPYLSNHIRRVHGGVCSDSDLALIDTMAETTAKRTATHAAKPQVSNAPSMFFINQIIETLELIKKYKCPVCGIAFVREETVEIHCKRNHPGMYVSREIKNLPADLNGEISTVIQREQKCPACDGIFATKSDLVAHLRSAHQSQTPFKCSLCGMLFSRTKTLDEHRQTHFSSELQCAYCGKKFKQKISLKKHIRRHVGPNVIQCTVCNIPYSEQKLLDSHFRSHLAGKPHQCDYCDERFAQSCDKTKHMRIHTGERPYACEICQQKFSQLTSLRKHRYLHSDERNYQCSVCGKAFRFNSNLAVHMRTHTGERPYACQVCGKSFSTSGHLGDHMKIHQGKKDHKCDECDKEFIHSASLAKHKRVHSGEKPYHCTYCYRSFSQVGHFKEHLRIHTNERPYHCKKCGSKFRRKDALNTHMQSHERMTRKQQRRNDEDDEGDVWDTTEPPSDEAHSSAAKKIQSAAQPIVGSDGYTNFSYKISM